MNKINVLSLFDGISGCRVALDRIGIETDRYYASEIDKYAIQIAQHNYPDTKQLGSVLDFESWDIDWSSIGLVTGGFPCQAWSIAGKQLGDKDERGMLFWTMLDVMKKVREHNPNVDFLIENVKMKKEFEEYITFHTTEALGDVHKILINSSLVSAQNRQRYYWTSFEVEQPEDKGILLKDILDGGYVDREKSYCIDANYGKGGNLMRYFCRSSRQLVFEDKEFLLQLSKQKVLIDLKESVAKNVREQHSDIITSDKDFYAMECESGWQDNKIALKKSPTLRAGNSFTAVLDARKQGVYYYRKLTPLECERLQTLPEITYYAIINIKELLYLEQAKNFVSAVKRNPKLLRHVLSAEKKELKDYVKNAIQSMSASHQLTKHTAQENAGTQTQKQIELCMRKKRQELCINAKIVAKIVTSKNQNQEGDFVAQNVFINLTGGRITHNGKAESLLSDNSLCAQKSGSNVVKMSTKEIMQLVEDVESETAKKKDTSFTSTILNPLSSWNQGQILTILYYFAKSAIDGHIAEKTKIENLYLSLTNGYTSVLGEDGKQLVSNSQRYKAIGNGWTIDVIAHILKQRKEM